MTKYRFIKFEQGYKWYAESQRGAVAGINRNQARLFTEDDWNEWGEAGGWTKEELGEDQLMALAKMPTLPGLEL